MIQSGTCLIPFSRPTRMPTLIWSATFNWHGVDGARFYEWVYWMPHKNCIRIGDEFSVLFIFVDSLSLPIQCVINCWADNRSNGYLCVYIFGRKEAVMRLHRVNNITQFHWHWSQPRPCPPKNAFSTVHTVSFPLDTLSLLSSNSLCANWFSCFVARLFRMRTCARINFNEIQSPWHISIAADCTASLINLRFHYSREHFSLSEFVQSERPMWANWPTTIPPSLRKIQPIRWGPRIPDAKSTSQMPDKYSRKWNFAAVVWPLCSRWVIDLKSDHEHPLENAIGNLLMPKLLLISKPPKSCTQHAFVCVKLSQNRISFSSSFSLPLSLLLFRTKDSIHSVSDFKSDTNQFYT